MENSQSLSIESFSYSWLVNMNPSFENLEGSFRSTSNMDASDDYEEAAFIEMDPTLSPSKRFSNVSIQDLNNFNFPISSESHIPLVHADKLISNGSVMPLLINPMINMETNNYHASHDSMINSESSSFIKKQVHLPKLSSGIIQKLYDFFKPLCQKIKCGFGCTNGSTVIEGTILKKRECSHETSPRTSLGYSVDDWRRSCDSESSIQEAVLHCKRTIGE